MKHLPGLTIDDLNRYLPAVQSYKEINLSKDKMKEGLFLTDCLKGIRRIPADSIDLIITDPTGAPFIDKQFKLEDYYQWNKNWLIEARRGLKEAGSIYLMTNWQYSSMFHSLLNNIFKVRSRIIWRNKSSKVENKKGWIDDTSDIWYATKSNEFIFLKNDESKNDINNINHSNSNLWVDIPRGLDKNSKYSQKLYLRMIKSSTYKLNWVLDPFMSIGDVGVASKVSGRRFIGFEKDKDSLLLAMKKELIEDKMKILKKIKLDMRDALRKRENDELIVLRSLIAKLKTTKYQKEES